MLLLLQIYNNKFILPQTNPIINTLKYVKCISIWLKAVEVTSKFEKNHLMIQSILVTSILQISMQFGST